MGPSSDGDRRFNAEPAENDTAKSETANEYSSKSPWKSLFNFTKKKHLPLALPSVLFAVASGCVIPGEAFLLGKIFNSFAQYGAGQITKTAFIQTVNRYCLYLAFLGVGSWFLYAGFYSTWTAFGALQAGGAREMLFHGMLQRELSWFDLRKHGVGALLARLNGYMTEFQLATSTPLGLTIEYITTTVACFVLSMYFSWDLTLVTISTVPLAAIAVAFFSRRIQPNIDAQAERLGEAAKHTTNAFNSIECVKCFNGQDMELWKYVAVMGEAAKFYARQIYWNSAQGAFLRLTTLGMFVQGFWYGSSLVSRGKREPGAVLTTFWAAMLATQACMAIMPLMIVLEKGRMAGAKLRAVIAEMEKEERRQGREIGLIDMTKTCRGDLVLRNVTFAYPARPKQQVLKNVSMSFPAGRLTFVIGKSGSGKSTIGQLLMRFYKPSEGEIELDGRELQTLHPTWIRDNVMLVEQTSVLFEETVSRNIAFGSRDYDNVKDADVCAAASFALLDVMIKNMSKGYNTMIGAKGSTLSGGQRQRMALARARIRDPQIIILDESTSALDYINRTLIMDAIRKWRRGKTTIIITHDISQILPDDYVYILKQGEVVQQGPRKSMAAEAKRQSQLSPLDAIKVLPFDSNQQSHPASIISAVHDSPPSSPDTEYSLQDPLDKYLSTRGLTTSRFIPSVFTNRYGTSAQRDSMHSRRLSTISDRSHLRHSMPQSLYRLSSMRKNDAYEMMEDPETPITVVDVEENVEEVKQKKEEVKTLKLRPIFATIWPCLEWSSRIWLTTGFFWLVVYAISTPIFSFVFSKLLSTFYLPQNRAHLAMVYSLATLGIAITDSFASFIYTSQLQIMGQVWVNKIRVEGLRRILEQPRQFFNEAGNDVSRLAECLDSRGEVMQSLLGRFLPAVVLAGVMLSVSVVWSLVACWKLTLVGLATTPILYMITAAFEAVQRKMDEICQDEVETVSAIFTETFTAIKTVKSLTLEGYFRSKFDAANFKCNKMGVKRAIYTSLLFGLAESSMVFVTALLFYYGGVLVSNHEFPITSIITTFTELLFGFSGVQAILGFIPQMSMARDAASRLLRLARLPEISHEHEGNTRVTSVGGIHLNDLNFRYPARPDQRILHDLTLAIPSGSCVALVGSSGSGKSTIASLLLNLYPTEPRMFTHTPEITLSGRDMKHIHTQTLRNLITIVSQTPFLFPASIEENIAYGLRKSSPYNNTPSIRAAAVAAGVDDFIMSLPQGYSTVVGEGGMGVSGGQAQRISIARALVRNPNVLILDEATSALDVESAAIVRESINALIAADRERVRSMRSAADTISSANSRARTSDALTVIIITHGKEMMKMADKVIMLERGRLVEQGGYEELLKKRGLFYRLVNGEDWSKESEKIKRRSMRLMEGVPGVTSPMIPNVPRVPRQ
ncbi:ABC a-pheromone efflux pump AtrD [Rhizodiscina lignyota]|uniref:ABC a-pheromone efflux pump AtrD n=1 Tax=Rhizodiscina lignyota TaxID=1504668 RepID=A0A9P4M9V5_9PEZI|nr:ABC a-pheromone efflux pump AtrD [Rhizodiscina lignyota]